MRYLSLFSGIEAATQAWKPLGWECVGVSEIEPFPCAVLEHHYPDVPNLGDVTKITEEQVKELGQIDLIVFGSPCQNLSVAGNRKGLQGEQSSLFYSAMEIIRYARKNNGLRFALWENVPGSFSSNKGADFSAVVEQMAGLENIGVPENGWGKEGAAVGSNGLLEWSVLDAQFFGLAQRRKRVFALLDFGDWESRRPVLLEPEGLRGNTPPSREARQSATAITQAGFREGGFGEFVATNVAATTKASGGCLGGGSETLAVSLNSKQIGLDTSNVVASTLCANDYKEPQAVAIAGNIIGRSADNGGNHTGFDDTGSCYTLTAMDRHAVAFKEREATLYCGTQNDSLRDLSDNLCPTLRAGHGGGSVNPMVAYSWNGDTTPKNSEELSLTLRASQGGEGLGVAYSIVADTTPKIGEEINGTLRSQGGGGIVPPSVAQGSVVRRLTPIECERLQGFPDDFTKIPYRNKSAEDCPKGPRYKALGNSMAVPVMAWIGRKIEEAANGDISQE